MDTETINIIIIVIIFAISNILWIASGYDKK